MNYKILALVFIISTQAMGMEQSPQLRQPDFAQLKDLPNDLKLYIIPLIISGKPEQIAQGIYTTAAINKQFNALMNNPEKIIAILESLPYTANGIDVVECLQDKTATLPVMQSPEIKTWVTTAKAKLEDCHKLGNAIADEKKNAVVIQLLSNKNINLNGYECFGSTLLEIAAFTNNKEGIKLLLAAGVNSNYKTPVSQNTALIAAAKRNSIESATILLNHDANPNIQDHAGRTALMYAAEYGHIKIVELLLEAGANPDLMINTKYKARDIALYHNHPQIVKLLDKASEERKQK